MITRPGIEVRWLPEQRDLNGPFGIHQDDARTFADFLESFENNDHQFNSTLEDLRRFRNFRGRRWRPPHELVSKAHLLTYVDDIPCHESIAMCWRIFGHFLNAGGGIAFLQFVVLT